MTPMEIMREFGVFVVEGSDTPAPTPSTEPRTQNINVAKMQCDTCGLRPWDCACPVLECKNCELSPEDAALVDSQRCLESPDGKHDWNDRRGE